MIGRRSSRLVEQMLHWKTKDGTVCQLLSLYIIDLFVFSGHSEVRLAIRFLRSICITLNELVWMARKEFHVALCINFTRSYQLRQRSMLSGIFNVLQQFRNFTDRLRQFKQYNLTSSVSSKFHSVSTGAFALLKCSVKVPNSSSVS